MQLLHEIGGYAISIVLRRFMHIYCGHTWVPFVELIAQFAQCILDKLLMFGDKAATVNRDR